MATGEAALFSSDPALEKTVELIEEFRRHPACQLLHDLVHEGDSVDSEWDLPTAGRPAMDGDWACVVPPATSRARMGLGKEIPGQLLSGSRLVAPVGLTVARRGSRSTFTVVRRRNKGFGAFDEVARETRRRRSIRRRCTSMIEPRIGIGLFVDATAIHSASALEHFCERQRRVRTGSWWGQNLVDACGIVATKSTTNTFASAREETLPGGDPAPDGTNREGRS